VDIWDVVLFLVAASQLAVRLCVIGIRLSAVLLHGTGVRFAGCSVTTFDRITPASLSSVAFVIPYGHLS
jgi:hypothetical protein